MKTDTQLLEAYVDRGDRGAFDALVVRHYGHVYHVALRLVHDEFDARDVAQNVFVQAFRHADQVRDPTRLRAWLLRITVNEVRQQWRKRKPPTPVDELQLVFEDVHGPSVEKEASRREFELELEKALEQMPERLKVPLVLHYYQSLSLAEVASILEMPKSTVQHRVEKAVRLLRRRFRRRNPAVLLPLLAARFPSSPAAAGSVSSGLFTGGVLAVKTYVVLGVALLLVMLAATHYLGLLDGSAEAPRDHVGAPADRIGGEAAPGPAALLRGRADAALPAGASFGTPGGRAIHSAGPGRIVGHALTLGDARGVAGVRITLTLSSATDDDLGIAPFENTYVSGPTGSFVCDHLPRDGVYALVFHHPDHAYAELGHVVFGRGLTEVDVGAVLLGPAFALEGVVVDGAEQPLSGVTVCAGNPRRGPRPVTFHYREGRLKGACATTGADGRFRLTGLAAGYHRVLASKPGYASAGSGSVAVGRGSAAPLQLTLPSSRPIDGLVLDSESRPVPDAPVQVRLRETVHAGAQGYALGIVWAELRTDEQGRFRVEDCPDTSGPGLYVGVDVDHPDYEAFSEIYYDRPTSVLRIELTRPLTPTGAAFVVQVLDEVGRALTDVPGTAWVSLVTDENYDDLRVAVDERTGEARFAAVPPGTHHVGVELLGYRPRDDKVTIGDEPRVLSFPLERGAFAAGRVIDAVTGDPVPGATVATSDVNRVVTTADGRFRLHGLEGGIRQRGNVTVSAQGYLDAHPSLPFEKGVHEVEIEVALPPLAGLGTVAGRVVDTDGRPVAGATLSIRLSSPYVYRLSARSGVEGEFAIRAVVPTHLSDRSHVRITHPAHARADVWIPHAELERPLRLTLERGRRVRGRVVDEAGRPVDGVMVGAISMDDFGTVKGKALEHNAQDVDSLAGRLEPNLAAAAGVDGEGCFVLDHVPSDAVQILAFGATTRWLIEGGETGALVAKGAADVDDVIVRVWRAWTVRGRVEDPEGRPLGNALVEVPTFRLRARADDVGGFVLWPVFGASAHLEVSGSGHEARVEATPATADGLVIVATP